MAIKSYDKNVIKDTLKEVFTNHPDFKGVSFEGSGGNVLLDVLADNTEILARIANATTKENNLTTAQVHKNIERRSQDFGYLPGSYYSSRVKVKTSSSKFLPITDDLVFKTTDGNDTYEIHSLENTNPSLNTTTGKYETNIELVFGKKETFTHVFSETNKEIRIPSKKVDTSTITVKHGIDEYRHAKGISNVNSKSLVYYLKKNEFGEYVIYFGTGRIGKSPSASDNLIVTYLDSYGKATSGYKSSISCSNSDILATVSSGATDGTEGETVSEIKKNYKNIFASQNRAVTAFDYDSLIREAFPQYKAVSVYGGEKLVPKVLNTVFVCVRPPTSDQLSTHEKNRISDFLKTKNFMNSTIKFEDPDIVYMGFNSNINVDYAKTTLSTDEVKNETIKTIKNYFKENIVDFGDVFRFSRFSGGIDSQGDYIHSNETKPFLFTRKQVNGNRTFNVDFQNTISKGSLRTSFVTIKGKKGKFIDDSQGIVRFVDDKNQTITANVGKVDYSKGTVNITHDIIDYPKDTGGFIYFYVDNDANDVVPINNTIIDFNDSLYTENALIGLEKILNITVISE